ncbi:MAG: helix-turn-helix transcriptional regulator [Planctomycetota bacterium]|jgi:hypothetical protein
MPASRGPVAEVHTFTLALSGVSGLTPDTQDALFEAGCDDALFGLRDGVAFLDFDREAGSLSEAVFSAILDVARSGIGARVLRIEPDDLVSASEIARRLGRSRESIRLLIRGDRGPGRFPPPVSSLRGTSRLWSWVDVVTWFADEHRADEIDPETRERTRLIALVNAALALRRWNRDSSILNEIRQLLDRAEREPAEVSVGALERLTRGGA